MNKLNFYNIGWKAIIYRITSILIFSYIFGYKFALFAGGIAFIWYLIYDFIFHSYFNVKIQTEGKILWFTGLSGSGKTTLANALQQKLNKKGKIVQQLDGDILRKGISKDLGFSMKDREINLNRAIEIAKLLSKNNIIVLCSFISPIRKVRTEFKTNNKNFIEIYVNASLETCEKRDVKGLYKKARIGEIQNFTGISQPYQYPLNPDIICNTNQESILESVNKILNYLKKRRLI